MNAVRSLRDFELALDLDLVELDDLLCLGTFVLEKLVDVELADTFETVEDDVLLSKLLSKQLGSLLVGVVSPGELNDLGGLDWANLSLGISFCKLNSKNFKLID